MKNVVIFHLKRIWEGKDLWEEIKKGRKTSEWRDFSKYWIRRLCCRPLRTISHGSIEGEINFEVNGTKTQDLTLFLKVHRAWFVVGYPKGTLPRLEADITELLYHRETDQLEIKFTNVKEAKTK